ncbi:MAG: hypothetical protein J1F38_03135 [Muribaculaceae bacterium]|nr:hypothetical protein [Muribaculaceae bacterium]
MRGLGILILVVLFFWIVWPFIARWLKRKAIERAEDYMRASMGMPPRDKKSSKRDNNYSESQTFYQRERKNPRESSKSRNNPIIPKEYAEDVEFTEIIEFSEETIISKKNKENINIYHESQISDVEWTEVKKSGTK